MAGKSQIVMEENPFDENLQEMTRRWDAASYALMSSYAPRVQGYAQTNAPWTDQTGNARQGLAAKAGRDEGIGGSRVFIDLFHQMPYGIYLETRWSGRYQIIVPTIKAMGREVMAAASTLLRRLK